MSAPSTPTAFRQSGIVVPVVEQYLAQLRGKPDPLLARMREEGRRDGIPIVSDDTGALLAALVRIARPRHVVEFGTAIGYSTVFMARALAPGAHLTSFEIDPERHARAEQNLGEAGVRDEAEVRLELGDALELARDLQGPPADFAFLDAAKDEYRRYLDIVLEQLPPGGVVVVDNALMSGTVAVGAGDGHWSAEAIASQRAFNERFAAGEDGLQAVVLPVGDGVALGVRP